MMVFGPYYEACVAKETREKLKENGYPRPTRVDVSVRRSSVIITYDMPWDEYRRYVSGKPSKRYAKLKNEQVRTGIKSLIGAKSVSSNARKSSCVVVTAKMDFAKKVLKDAGVPKREPASNPRRIVLTAVTDGLYSEDHGTLGFLVGDDFDLEGVNSTLEAKIGRIDHWSDRPGTEFMTTWMKAYGAIPLKVERL